MVFFIMPFLVRDARRYYLAIASFINIFSSGWIFYHYTGLMLADLPMICLLFMALFTGKRFDWKASPIGLPVFGLIAWGILTSFGAKNQGWALAEVSKYIRLYLLMVIVALNIRSLSDLRLIIVSMLCGLVFEAALGFYQNYYGALGIWFLGERAGSRVDWRAMGTFYVAAFYANYVSLVLFVAYRMFVYYRPPKPRQIVFFGAAFFLGMIALFKSYARGPWIGFLASWAITSLISFLRSKYKVYSKYAVPVLVVFAILFTIKYRSKIAEQFGEGRRSAYESRFVQFGIAERMIAAKPLTGFGLANYDLNSWDFMTPEERSHMLARAYAMFVHNSFLLYTAEMGLIGGAIFILWFVVILWACVRILRAKISHPLITNATMGIAGGIIAFMVLCLSSPDIHEYSALYQLGLFGGILLGEWKLIKKAEWQNICSLRNGKIHPSETPSAKTIKGTR